jgi:hypothetical protein
LEVLTLETPETNMSPYFDSCVIAESKPVGFLRDSYETKRWGSLDITDFFQGVGGISPWNADILSGDEWRSKNDT